MNSNYRTEIVRTTSALTDSSRQLACNYNNAIFNFQDTSLLIARKLEHANFKKFLHLKDEWSKDTKFVSATGELFSNKYYQKIIDMGPNATPWIIREMKKKPGHWFYALRKITGANPVVDAHAGNVKAMTQDWLVWAKRNRIDE
jgi:hypothetical protein